MQSTDGCRGWTPPMTMGVVVVVLVGDRAGADVVGLAVGLEDVELSGWPCSLEVCLVELG